MRVGCPNIAADNLVSAQASFCDDQMRENLKFCLTTFKNIKNNTMYTISLVVVFTRKMWINVLISGPFLVFFVQFLQNVVLHGHDFGRTLALFVSFEQVFVKGQKVSTPFEFTQIDDRIVVVDDAQTRCDGLHTSQFEWFAVIDWIGCHQVGQQSHVRSFHLVKRCLVQLGPRTVDHCDSVLEHNFGVFLAETLFAFRRQDDSVKLSTQWNDLHKRKWKRMEHVKTNKSMT